MIYRTSPEETESQQASLSLMACARSVHTHITTAFVLDFLYPALSTLTCGLRFARRQRAHSIRRHAHYLRTERTTATTLKILGDTQLRDLPRCCPGCGAYTQFVSSGEAGFYSGDRKSVKAYLNREVEGSGANLKESELYNSVLVDMDTSLRSKLELPGGAERKGSKPLASIASF